MGKYVINGNPYFTICSVHVEIKAIFNRIIKSTPSLYESPHDFYNEIINDLNLGIEFIETAVIMGQRMEDSLKDKFDTPFLTFSNISLTGTFINEEEGGLNDLYNRLC